MSILRTLVLASLAPALLAQQQPHRPNPPSHELAEAEARAHNSPAIAQIKAGPHGSDDAVRQITGEPVDMGSPKSFNVPVLDDSVPLPVPAQYTTDLRGDRKIAPASGDPFFLGFAPGKYYPPAGEKIDPLLLSHVRSQYVDGRPSGETYAFVMFEKRMTEQRLAELRALGVRTLEFHPFYTMKVALAPVLIEQVAALDFVHWIGAPRNAQRVHSVLQQKIGEYEGTRPLDVYIDVYDSDLNPASREIVIATPVLVSPDGVQVPDPNGHAATKWMSNGWQQRALQAIGVDVTEYVDDIRAFRAKLVPSQLELLLALDFVQFVEADLPMEMAAIPEPHDESTAMVYSDLNRAYYSGATTSSAVGGQADSGLDIAHSDLGVWGVGWDFAATGTPWADGCEHGSHVAGSILGRGNTNPSFRGQAPGLGWGGAGRFFVARIFDNSCLYGGASLSSIMNVLNTSYFDGVSTSPRPHVINHSWGSTAGGGFFGTEADPRLIDDTIHDSAQLHIWASGNHGTTGATIGLQPSSKNTFTVGSVVDYPGATYGDPGSLYNNASDGSANGPTADGRWKPNAVAPGRWITSVDAGSGNGYDDKYGTSMATPHVTGLGAELVDHLTGFQGWPEPLSALMMTTAMTKDNQVHTSPGSSHLNNYGAGRIEGYRAHWTTGQIATYYWYFGIGNTSTNVEFPVSAGATRLVFTMFYSENAASAGASQALVNNYDTYMDYPPVDTANDNTGEWVLQQSSVDNTEIRIIDNPASYATGNWRFKVWPQSFNTGYQYMGLCAQIIYGSTTPDGTLSVTANDYYVQPNDNVAIDATVTNPSFVASAVVLDSTSSGDSLQSSSTTLGDGAVTNLLHNQSAGRDVTLGDIIHGSSRTGHWVTRWSTEGIKSWCVEARSDNWVDETQCINVIVDGTPPTLPPNLHSTSHTVNIWSNDNSLDFVWNPSSDGLSGVQGYGVSWGTAPGVFVANVVDTVPTNYTGLTLGDGATWYFAVKAADNCDNWTAGTSEAGPYKVDATPPTQPGPITSPTHTVNYQSCNTAVTVNWTASTDATSGVAHYWGVWNTTAVFDPVGGVNIPAGSTSYGTGIGSSTSARYFHLRAIDNAGNLSATRHFGPIYANAASVTSYCTAKTNSLGCLPTIGALGQPDYSLGTFKVTCTNVINNKFGLMYWGNAPLAAPFQGGIKCVAQPTVRTSSITSGGAASGNSCTGSYSFTWTTAYLIANGISVGDTIYAQWWMRDPASASTTGLSNGIKFTVCD